MNQFGQKMTLLDKSECFRAFLLLIAQDRIVSSEERDIMMRVGKALDFERGFCEEAISDLLENEHITKDPPVFSQKRFAEAFLQDCVVIAVSDHELQRDETDWILKIAQANGVDPSGLLDVVKKYEKEGSCAQKCLKLEIEAFI